MLKIASGITSRRWAARAAQGCAAAAVALACALAAAAPQDDYDKAAAAYREGDVTGAMRIVRDPAEAGHAPSQSLYALLLESAGIFEDSVAYFRKAAEQGDVEGQFGLATALAAGKGVARDPVEARRLFEEAAKRGHKQSVEVMAEVVMKGGLGLEKVARPEGAQLEWVRKAAESNYLPALDYLAAGYRDGSVGAVDAKLAQDFEARAEKLRYPNGRPRTRRR